MYEQSDTLEPKKSLRNGIEGGYQSQRMNGAFHECSIPRYAEIHFPLLFICVSVMRLMSNVI